MATNPSVEDIVIRYMTRYERLDQAISYAFAGYENARQLNIYIDLFGLFRTIISKSYRTQIKDYNALTSGVIGICAHYRNYFNRIGVSTKIFIISSFNIPSVVRAFLPEYNKSMIEKLGNKVILDMVTFNLDILELLCPYLPDIHFIKTEYESSVLMYEIMKREGESIPSLIISSDLYPLQLTNKLPNVAYLWPRKSYGTFKSRGVDTDPQYEKEVIDVSPICPPKSHPEYQKSFTYVITRKLGKNASETNRGYVNASNQVLLQALNNFPERDLKTKISINKASKIINEVASIDNQTIYPEDIKDIIESNNLDFKEISNRYKALDVNYQHLWFQDSIEYANLHYDNLQDPDALNMINTKFFKNNPLDLYRL